MGGNDCTAFDAKCISTSSYSGFLNPVDNACMLLNFADALGPVLALNLKAERRKLFGSAVECGRDVAECSVVESCFGINRHGF